MAAFFERSCSFIDKWGLALAGGGTRGAYHLGAWKALGELGVEIGAVVGTSIGSVNGALFAQGQFETAVRLWQSISAADVLDLGDGFADSQNLLERKNIIPLAREVIRKNGLGTMPFEETLRGVIDEEKLRNSDIEYGLNTTSVRDMESLEVFIEDIPKGKLIDMIMASSCFPGFRKRYIDDKAYADGGIMNNLPLDMLFKRGYKNVIAVDVGGVGMFDSFRCYDTNVVKIHCKKPMLGIFEFDRQAIEKSMKQSYYDTYKAFGRLVGNDYYFNTNDYFRARARYSDELLSGLEIAARAFGIEEIAVYRVESLIDGVVRKYERLSEDRQGAESTIDAVMRLGNDRAVIVRLADMILKSHADGLNNKLVANVLGNRLTAANAVAYFVNNFKK